MSSDTPIVFLSYSHDTKVHKAWVADLGRRLRENGVEVILDQWDTELGDNLPKFMERSVSGADRVLMVCTEPYVKKVDAGKGGAGYEAMIVTAELVMDQGLNKFIPIIRQAENKKAMPICLGTRKYVDLSEGRNFDEGFQELLETIHKVVSARKPPLGPSPFPRGAPTLPKPPLTQKTAILLGTGPQPLPVIEVQQMRVENPTMFYSPPEDEHSFHSRYFADFTVKNCGESAAMNLVISGQLIIPPNPDPMLSCSNYIGILPIQKTGMKSLANFNFMFPVDREAKILEAVRRNNPNEWPLFGIKAYYKNPAGECFSVAHSFNFSTASESQEGIIKEWCDRILAFPRTHQRDLDRLIRLEKQDRIAWDSEFHRIKKQVEKGLGNKPQALRMHEIPGGTLCQRISDEAFTAGVKKACFGQPIPVGLQDCMFEKPKNA